MKRIDTSNITEIQLIFILITALIVSFTACGQDEQFKETSTGLKYKFYERSKQEANPESGQIMSPRMKYYNQNDSVLFDSKELPGIFRLPMRTPQHQGSIEEGFAMMQPGDSAAFIVKADSFYLKTMGKQQPPKWVDENSQIIFQVKLLEILSDDEYKQEQKMKNMQRKEAELLEMESYLEQNKIETEPTTSGLYIIIQKQGNGKKVKPGQKVTVHYEGKFLNDVVFDSSYEKEKPFTFVLGAGKVIPAWEEGISKLRVGDKARLIVPSYLAYGKKGVESFIPPYSTLMFDIEVIKTEK
jgi:FKBP-type peptidyl-prolyl cis-trans isomerase FkpA